MLFFRICHNCFRGLVKDIGDWTEDILAVVIKLALLGLADGCYSFICDYCHDLGVVNNMDDLTDEDRSALINVSQLFGCKYLETVCVNVRNDEEFLNPSIGTFLNDEMGCMMKKHFLNSSTYADIIFKVEG